MQNISDEKHTQAITRRTHTRTTEKHKGLSGLGQMFIKTDPQWLISHLKLGHCIFYVNKGALCARWRPLHESKQPSDSFLNKPSLKKKNPAELISELLIWSANDNRATLDVWVKTKTAPTQTPEARLFFKT